MLTRSFIHIPTVGPKTELAIWRAGIADWQDFMLRGEELLPKRIYALGLPVIMRSIEALEDPSGAARLAAMFPAREHWRFFPAYKKVVYLDIETGGDPEEWGGVTVVGLYDGHRVEQFVADHNMWFVNDAMKGYDVVCTFSGKSFDVPVLQQVFTGLSLPPIHIDLRWVLKKLELKGGLKRIEAMLGLKRPEEVGGMNGADAVMLWAMHTSGDPDALATLLMYNACDIENLKPLLEGACNRLSKRLTGRVLKKPRGWNGWLKKLEDTDQGDLNWN